MDRDTITRLARDAGFDVNFDIWAVSVDGVHINKELHRFAALIENYLDIRGIHSCHAECQRPGCVMVRKAVAREREECAKVCEDDVRTWSHPGSITREECAAAIRSRT